MRIIADRIRALRNGAMLSQEKMANIVGVKQSSVNRYENDQSSPASETLLKYADYFDVSMDYIFGRTDKPQGILYEYKPVVGTENAEFAKFVEMCFDPSSPMNEKLKQALLDMAKGEKT